MTSIWRSPPTEEPPPAAPEREGFSTKQITAEIKSVVFLPVNIAKTLNPHTLKENSVVNSTINYLAQQSLVNNIFKGFSEAADDLSGAAATGAEQLEDLFDVSGAAEGEAAMNELIDSSGVGDFSFGEYFDAAGNRINAAGKTETEVAAEAEEVCVTDSAQNGQFLADAALIKEYLFRTNLLLFSFWAVYNWAYLFFHVIESPEESGKCWYMKLLFPEKVELNFDNIPFGSLFGGVLKDVVATFLLFNPFMHTQKFMKFTYQMLQEFSATFRGFYDKKVWFIFLLYAVIKSNFFFFENYDPWMKDISKMRPNKYTGYIFMILVYFYFQSFITEFSIARYLGFVVLIWILYVLAGNIYIWICMSFNVYVILFILLIGYILLSMFALFLVPSPNPFLYGVRMEELVEGIKKSATAFSSRAKEEEWPWYYSYTLRGLHMIYDNLFFLTLMFWFIYGFYLFDTKLKYELLRENMFAILGMAAGVLMLWKTFIAAAGEPDNINKE